MEADTQPGDHTLAAEAVEVTPSVLQAPHHEGGAEGAEAAAPSVVEKESDVVVPPPTAAASTEVEETLEAETEPEAATAAPEGEVGEDEEVNRAEVAEAEEVVKAAEVVEAVPVKTEVVQPASEATPAPAPAANLAGLLAPDSDEDKAAAVPEAATPQPSPPPPEPASVARVPEPAAAPTGDARPLLRTDAAAADDAVAFNPLASAGDLSPPAERSAREDVTPSAGPVRDIRLSMQAFHPDYATSSANSRLAPMGRDPLGTFDATLSTGSGSPVRVGSRVSMRLDAEQEVASRRGSRLSFGNVRPPSAVSFGGTSGDPDERSGLLSFQPTNAGSETGHPPSGRFGALANLLNCILDAGLVGVPYALGQSGLALGIVLVVATGVLTCYGLELLVTVSDSAARCGAISCVAYEEVAELAGGQRLRLAVLASQFLFCVGALVGYVFVIKDNLADAIFGLVHHGILSGDGDNYLYATIVTCGLVFPLCCLRSVADLGHFSAFTVGIVIMMLALFSVNAAQHGFEGESWSPVARPTFINTIGTCIFAFMCHHNEFSIYRSLGRKATPENFRPVLRGAVAVSVLISLGIGVVVYASFGNSLESDIFKNYVRDSVGLQIAKIGMVINMLLSFPMNFGVAREMLQVMVAQVTAPKEVKRRHTMQRASTSFTERREAASRRGSAFAGPCAVSDHASCMTSASFGMGGQPLTLVYAELDRPPRNIAESAAGGGVRDNTSNALHMLTTIPLFVVAVGVGLAVPDLGPTLNLVGGLLGSLIGFVFPAYMALILEDEPYGGRGACYMLMAVGAVAGLAGTTSSIVAFF
eukprot:Rhum_TRINITY_DN2230_c0_g1::Rhum_TRINITY_DN2230_c0_g1_i1::g.6437::m.6437/K14997/SLC38A11; solute carrier family 38 (sodium-coupled neutral amino acid transporter), member 11